MKLIYLNILKALIYILVLKYLKMKIIFLNNRNFIKTKFQINISEKMRFIDLQKISIFQCNILMII